MRRSIAHAVFALLVTSPLGCGLVLGLEDPKDRTTSSAGDGGDGGGQSTSTSATTSAGGGGGGATCDLASCPGTACAPAICADGRCATEKAPLGAPCDEGGGKVCDGQGACVECLTAGDCAAPNGCQTPVCTAGVCGTTNVVDGPAPPGACPNCTTTCAGAEAGLCSAGACLCGDNATIAKCDGECVDLESDPDNCGTCGYVCSLGAACVASNCDCPEPGADCGGTGCVDFSTDPSHCGRCDRACAPDQICVAGACAAPPAPPGTVNLTASTASGVQGGMTITAGSAAGFAIGKEVLIHQTQGASAGAWEEAVIASVNGNVITLAAPLAHTYTVSATDHAQIVLVEAFVALDVPAGVTLSAPPWNGATGGILAIHVTGAMTVEGAVSMSGRGFRGASHPCSGATTNACQRGQAGESHLGVGKQSIQANGAAGGGGSPGQDCGMAGGGSHGTQGEVGVNHTMPGGMCTGASAANSEAGVIAGVPDLAAQALFGGAGGEGGADEDGAFAGKGGNGGGFVLIRAGSLAVGAGGRISSDGEAGGEGSQIACGGNVGGSGMAGGGGGAGGAVRIVAPSVDVIGQVTALGGGGGYCAGAFSSAPPRGGAGGKGRIAIQANNLGGATDPPFFGG